MGEVALLGHSDRLRSRWRSSADRQERVEGGLTPRRTASSLAPSRRSTRGSVRGCVALGAIPLGRDRRRRNDRPRNSRDVEFWQLSTRTLGEVALVDSVGLELAGGRNFARSGGASGKPISRRNNSESFSAASSTMRIHESRHCTQLVELRASTSMSRWAAPVNPTRLPSGRTRTLSAVR
jgi:hypothetical protein